MQIKRLMAIFFAMALLAIGLAVPTSPASAQQEADGLVVVQIKNIKDVLDVAVAADVVAQACGIDVDVVAGIIAAIDAGDENKTTICRTVTGDKVAVAQNH